MKIGKSDKSKQILTSNKQNLNNCNYSSSIHSDQSFEENVMNADRSQSKQKNDEIL